MHPEADAFLDAIFDHPDDDTPRLVYADWLQEHGHEDYAQFIRLQCAAAREMLWSDEANRLWEEIGRVWHRLVDEWQCSLLDWDWMDAISFHRGFLEPGFQLSDADLFASSPLWQHPELLACVTIGFNDGHPFDLKTPGAALLQVVRVLRITILDGAYLDELLETRFENVRELDLRSIEVRNDIGRVLLTSESLPNLRRLLLTTNLHMSQNMATKLKEHFGPRLILG